jgi:AcrR family transcriptional regulator
MPGASNMTIEAEFTAVFRTRQQEKSATTRRRILDAVLTCYAECGYYGTTVQMVAECALVSRGALQYHFPTGLDLLAGAIDYLNDKRLRAFRNAVSSLDPGKDRLASGLRAYHQQIGHPLYHVLVDLKAAARTDGELAAILHPALEEFDPRWFALACELFPEWAGEPDRLRLALDVLHYLMDGIAVNPLVQGSEAHIAGVMEYLEANLRALRPGAN